MLVTGFSVGEMSNVRINNFRVQSSNWCCCQGFEL